MTRKFAAGAAAVAEKRKERPYLFILTRLIICNKHV